MSKKLKLLFINYEYPPIGSGGGNLSMCLAQEISKTHPLYFLTVGWHDFRIIKRDQLTIHKLKTSRRHVNKATVVDMISFLINAWRVIPQIKKRFHPNIILVFFTIPTGILVFHPALRKVPYIVSTLGSDVPYHNPSRFRILYMLSVPLVKHIWKKAAVVVSNSILLKKEILAVSPSQNILVISNGVDTTRFKPVKNKKKSARINLLYVGRLLAFKRVNMIIEALPKIIRSSNKKIFLRIVGSGDEEVKLRNLVNKLSLQRYVSFIKDCFFDKIHKEYLRADIYVHLSKVESMSCTLLEAMACGLPIITSNVGGTKELIHHNGFIITRPSPELVAKMIIRYINNQSLIKRHGIESRSIALKFSWNNATKKYLDLFNRIAPYET